MERQRTCTLSSEVIFNDEFYLFFHIVFQYAENINLSCAPLLLSTIFLFVVFASVRCRCRVTVDNVVSQATGDTSTIRFFYKVILCVFPCEWVMSVCSVDFLSIHFPSLFFSFSCHHFSFNLIFRDLLSTCKLGFSTVHHGSLNILSICELPHSTEHGFLPIE